MKSNQKLAILFWLKKSKTTKDGMAPVYVRMTIDGKEESISLSRKVHPKFWDTKLKRVTESSADARATNLKIGLVENELERHFIVLQSQHEDVTPLMLKNVFLGLPTKFNGSNHDQLEASKVTTLLNAFTEFITSFELMVKNKTRSNETLKHWRTTKAKVSEFIQLKFKLKDLDLCDIRPTFGKQFYKYVTLEVDEPLAEVTAKMHIKKTRQIIEQCVTDELIDKNPLKGFKCGGGEKDVIPLEMAQVQSMYKKEITVKRLAEVRDAFIFQCFTGYAFQDLYGLTQQNIIKVGNKGERWPSKERGKTGVNEMVPILPIIEGLIKKYANHPYCKKNGCLMPVNSNAKYNAYLKELAIICGINRDLNTHLARHTFADMMLNNGVPLEDVSKMLGHKSIRTTVRYCGIKKNRISLNVNKVRAILFNKNGEWRNVS